MLNFFYNLPPSERRITVSTALTLARIALVPCIVVAMLYNSWGWACGLFIIAAVTDALDGALARWLNDQTFLGACLDPIADKFLLLSCFSALAFIQEPLSGVPLWFVMMIVLKELLLITGAFFIYYRKGSVEIKPTMLGKTTTVIQIGFIMWLFACYFFGWVPLKTYYILLGSMLAASAISFAHYVSIGIEQVRR